MYFFATLALYLIGRPGWEITQMKCPDFEQVIDYLDGKLTPAETERVTAHLASDSADCTETRAWYERLRTVGTSDYTLARPAWVFKQTVRIFDTTRTPRLPE